MGEHLTTRVEAKRRRLLLWLVAVLVALVFAFGCHYFWWQVRVYLALRHSTEPALEATPRPLEDESVSTSPSTRLCYFGYSFEVPGTGITKQWGDGRWIKVQFASGQEVFFGNPAYWQDDVLGRYALSDRIFDEVVPAPPKTTKYNDLRTVLFMTPSKLWPLTSHAAFKRRLSLLLAKGSWLGHPFREPVILEVRKEGYEGFETSGLPDGGVGVTLFDPSDRMYRMSISHSADVKGSITQADANRMIASFGPAPSCPAPISNPVRKR